MYALAMIVFAFGEAFRSGTHKAIILKYLQTKGIEDHKVEYYGHTRSASQLGAALAALIAAGIVFYTGNFRILFFFSIIPCILGLLLIISYPVKIDKSLICLGENLKVKLIAQIRATVRNFSNALHRQHLLRGFANSASFDAFFKATESYLQPIMQIQALTLPVLLFTRDYQQVAIIVGSIYFIIHITTSYGAKNACRIATRACSLPAAANIAFIIGISLLATVSLSVILGSYIISIAAFLGLHLIYNIRRPIIVGHFADIIPHHTMATCLSIETQLRTLLVAGVTPLAGFLADKIGIGEALLIITVIATLTSITLRLRNEKNRI